MGSCVSCSREALLVLPPASCYGCRARVADPGGPPSPFHAPLVPPDLPPGRHPQSPSTPPAPRKILACIGEQFDDGEEICGGVVNVRAKQYRIALWTRTAANEAVQVAIAKQLKEVLQMSDHAKIGFMAHVRPGAGGMGGAGMVVPTSGGRQGLWSCVHSRVGAAVLAHRACHIAGSRGRSRQSLSGGDGVPGRSHLLRPVRFQIACPFTCHGPLPPIPFIHAV